MQEIVKSEQKRMNTYYTEHEKGIIPVIDNQAVIVHNVMDLNTVASALDFRCTVTLFVIQGDAHWSGHDEDIAITKGDLLIHNMENKRAELVAGNGFSMIALCVSSEFTRTFAQSIKISWEVRQALITNALFHLSIDDRHYIVENYDFLKTKCQGKDFPQRPAILKQLLQILSVEMLLRIESYIEDTNLQNEKSLVGTQNIQIGNTSSAQNIFCRFTSLLEQTPVKNRPVSWWASRVNVSAKYLSAICREVEGKSARTLIAESVIQEATKLLQNPELSVKEISDRLGFVNQSHFGTFFKRHTGHSPNH